MAKRKNSFKPVVVYDAMGYIRQHWLAAECEEDVVRLVMADTTKPYLYTREVMLGQIGSAGGKTRYIIADKDPTVVALSLKDRANAQGATPEAIRLIGLITPISKEELNTMAKENKLSPKKGDVEGLKSAAKKAPVGGATAAKGKKGNPEALEKARAINAGKQAEMRAKKIKALKKPKDITAREGSFRHTMLTDLLSCKTVGEFYDKSPTDSKSKYDAGCLRYAEGAEFIELS